MELTLKKFFGFSNFRPYQKEVIEKIMEGRDCLAVMATGSGKSLCYQVPPLIAGNTGIVVSPLLSLMQDQVMALKQRGIQAEYLGSTQTDKTVQTKAESGFYSLLFMTPEKACAIPNSFWTRLLKAGICLFAVDEAHCISEWGHDFRTEYKQLDKLRPILSDVPFVSLTATATDKVRLDIIKSLKMKDPYVAVGSFDRKNLFYGVKSFNRGIYFLDELVQEVSKSVATAGSTIIYCLTIKDVEQIHQLLESAGIKAGIYHGQMGNKAREEAHRLFIRDELSVMVATIAFGMGIDKPNIRQVIHYGCPKSLETYYQESGRCGRDGIASVCWLYYTRSDFAKSDFYCSGLQTENQRKAVVDSLMEAQKYCMLTTCRRKFLLEHFGEMVPAENCGNCDNCTTTRRERDMSKEAYLLMACIHSCRGNWGLNLPIDVLRGSRSKKIVDAQFDKLPLHGLGKAYSSNWWKSLGSQLISHGYLKETISDVYRFVSVSTKGAQYLKSAGPDHQPPLILPIIDEMCEEDEGAPGQVEGLKTLTSSECEGLTEAEVQLYHTLLAERAKLARATGTAPYAICGEATIKKIALVRPSTRARLANIDGVNQHFVTTYGDHFLQAIRHLSQDLNMSLDGELSIQTVSVKKVTPVQNLPKKLTPAKFEAWRMWHEDRHSIEKIANFPGRSAPIKEGTVLSYLLEAFQEGLATDWPRFCAEIELTPEMFSSILDAVTKVGSTEKLKPIKDELPENVNYSHIKAGLTMLSCGISSPSELNPLNKANEVPEAAESSPKSLASCLAEESCNLDHKLPKNRKDEETDFDCDMITSKRCKIDKENDRCSAMSATQSSIVEWLKNYGDGVALHDIIQHFKDSSEETIRTLLVDLEGEFVIYQKSGVYKMF
ncbi:uncharacterized protein LOC110734037 isoform X1 [Chenopodium quinoa]|uniref:uncharacterized protein LOC110734037 isoform X1 n=1 Tax=Chenopodium quinoa TaxID=63459 RepID=UPI000B785235|nr:uncharacterized protein LOC110734037 isoform X1 [Chenopodium quinoa]